MADSYFEVLLPLMGEGVQEATVTRWLKKPGERVERDEPLLEVSTDKVDTEIPSPIAGTLHSILVETDQVAKVNLPLGLLVPKDGSGVSVPKPASPAPKIQAQPPTPEPSLSRQPSARPVYQRSQDEKVLSTPVARKLAAENDLRLEDIAGSGEAGRVTLLDVESHLRRQAAIPAYAHGKVQDPEAELFSLATDWRDGKEYLDGVLVRREKFSKMRRLIAEHMVRSVRVSPHVTTVFEIDLSRVIAHRLKNKEAFEKKHGTKLTFTPYFIHAAVAAIKEHPIVNTSLDGDTLLWKDDINIGCAVAIDSGLIVPVIKKAQDKSFEETALALSDLVSRARNKKLLPQDVQGGSFSITNPGGFGSLTSNPIINQPQVAILGIGAITDRPVAVLGKVEIRPQILISLTFDHRVVDGEGGAKYLATLREILERGAWEG